MTQNSGLGGSTNQLRFRYQASSNMPQCVVRNQEFLKQLHSSKAVHRTKLIKKASKDNIDAISEVALNTLRGNIPLNPKQKRELKKHRSKIRSLVHSKSSVKKRKHILVQKGGFLPLLLTPFLSILGGLAANALSHTVGL